jgi:DNA repair protein RecO
VARRPYQEDDVRVTLLSHDLGRLTAVAKGARKPAAHYCAWLVPPSQLHVQLWRGRGDFVLLTEAEPRHLYPRIKRLPGKLLVAELLCEVASALLEPYQTSPVPDLLASALSYLERHAPPPFFAGAFAVKAAVVEGLLPPALSCGICGAAHAAGIRAKEGLLACASCRPDVRLPAFALSLLQSAASGRISQALAAAAQAPKQAGVAEEVALSLFEAVADVRLSAREPYEILAASGPWRQKRSFPPFEVAG